MFKKVSALAPLARSCWGRAAITLVGLHLLRLNRGLLIGGSLTFCSVDSKQATTSTAFPVALPPVNFTLDPLDFVSFPLELFFRLHFLGSYVHCELVRPASRVFSIWPFVAVNWYALQHPPFYHRNFVYKFGPATSSELICYPLNSWTSSPYNFDVYFGLVFPHCFDTLSQQLYH